MPIMAYSWVNEKWAADTHAPGGELLWWFGKIKLAYFEKY